MLIVKHFQDLTLCLSLERFYKIRKYPFVYGYGFNCSQVHLDEDKLLL